MSYRRSSTYSYPPKFNKLEEVSDYAMRLYKELLENDSRGEWMSTDLGNVIDGGAFTETPLVLIDGGGF